MRVWLCVAFVWVESGVVWVEGEYGASGGGVGV